MRAVGPHGWPPPVLLSVGHSSGHLACLPPFALPPLHLSICPALLPSLNGLAFIMCQAQAWGYRGEHPAAHASSHRELSGQEGNEDISATWAIGVQEGAQC